MVSHSPGICPAYRSSSPYSIPILVYIVLFDVSSRWLDALDRKHAVFMDFWGQCRRSMGTCEIILFPKNRVRVLLGGGMISLPAIVVLGFWIVLQFISQLGQIGSSAETAGVAYWAHIGGFLAGIFFAFIFRRPAESSFASQYRS